MFPCSPFPHRPAPAASAIVVRFRVSTEVGAGLVRLFCQGGPWDLAWWTADGKESIVGKPGVEGWLGKAGALGAELPTNW